MPRNEKHFVVGKRIAWIAGCMAFLAFYPSHEPLARAASSIRWPSAKLVSLQIDPSTVRIHGTGETIEFAAIGGYSDGSVRLVTEEATWNSSDPNIAIVSNETGSQGRTVSVSYGSVAITATLEELRASALLTVSPIWCPEP